MFLGSICRFPHGALGRLAWGCFLTRLWGGNGDFVRAQVACVVDGSVVRVVVVMVLTGDGAAGLQQSVSPARVCGTNICAGVCASKQGYWSASDCVTLSSTDRLTCACLRSPTVPTEPVTSPACSAVTSRTRSPGTLSLTQSCCGRTEGQAASVLLLKSVWPSR